MKIVNVAEMRRIEQLADAGGHSYASMMELAGRAVADAALRMGLIEPEDSALVLVGPGNNGGDGLVAARFLREAGHDVVIYVWKRDIKGDENFRLLKRRRRGVAILWAENDPDFAKLRDEVSRTSLIIDALLGTGVDRPLDPRLRELLAAVSSEVQARRRLEAEESDYEIITSPTPILEAMLYGNPLAGGRDPSLAPDEPWSAGLRPPLDGALNPGADRFDSEDGGDEDLDEFDDLWLDEYDEGMWPPAPVLAVDCPSGLNCNTGEIDPYALAVEATVTFAYPKWGQLQEPGASACGLLYVAEIGIPPQIAESISSELVGPHDMRTLVPVRPSSAHKGTFGKALVVGGSLNYTGAIVLAGAAAARAGAGLVTAAIPLPLHAAVAGAWPELTWLALAESDSGTHSARGAERVIQLADGYDALLIGPGLTSGPEATEFLMRIFGNGGLAHDAWSGRVVADADALNILSKTTGWHQLIPPGSVLTPHPGEMARLTGSTADAVNSRRIETAQRGAGEWGHIVLLKGPYTVVAAPDGRVRVIPFATAALATAGSGDVLAGLIAGYLAQRLPAFDAAVLAAYLHGAVGVALQLANGRAAVTARDILQQVPDTIRRLAPRS